jgi:hypothetical protein
MPGTQDLPASTPLPLAGARGHQDGCACAGGDACAGAATRSTEGPPCPRGRRLASPGPRCSPGHPAPERTGAGLPGADKTGAASRQRRAAPAGCVRGREPGRRGCHGGGRGACAGRLLLLVSAWLAASLLPAGAQEVPRIQGSWRIIYKVWRGVASRTLALRRARGRRAWRGARCMRHASTRRPRYWLPWRAG